MAFLAEYGLFLVKTITLLIAIMIVLGMIFGGRAKEKTEKGELDIQDLNEHITETTKQLIDISATNEEKKSWKKEQKELLKKHKKEPPQRLFVINFKGDIQAQATVQLREEINALLSVATEKDEVLLRLESPGGVVHGYGLASSQLHRIKQAKIPLTIAVDKVAASGGYMMAVVADKIIAAPFAILGSIGVIGQIPNFNKLLKKAQVDFEMHTAGEYKRSLTMLGENTDEDRTKFKEDLEDIHQLFKSHVSHFRPQLNIDEIANGDTWFGRQCIDNHLIDEIKTSDEYLLEKCKTHRVYELNYKQRKSLQQKLMGGAEQSVDGLINTLLTKARSLKFFS